MRSPETLTDQIISAGKWLADRKMVAGADGNISVRLGPDRLLITPSGFALDRLTPDNLVTVGADGEVLGGSGKPSSELAAHLFFYRKRPAIGAVVHSHPPYATAFAAAGVELDWRVLPEMVVWVGPVALTKYAAPGTSEVPATLEPFIVDHHAFLLRNHGLITVGRTLDQALQRHEIIEHGARILFLSRLLGGPDRIPQVDLMRLNQMRKSLDTL
jgi:L-fuculose-phosphate aldolase